jgi:hypothetical protein
MSTNQSGVDELAQIELTEKQDDEAASGKTVLDATGNTDDRFYDGTKMQMCRGCQTFQTLDDYEMHTLLTCAGENAAEITTVECPQCGHEAPLES